MDMVEVSSSNIARVGYDNPSRTLRIEFHNGTAYEYFDVPDHIYAGFLNPPNGSVGQFFSQNVKGHYRYSRL